MKRIFVISLISMASGLFSAPNTAQAGGEGKLIACLCCGPCLLVAECAKGGACNNCSGCSGGCELCSSVGSCASGACNTVGSCASGTCNTVGSCANGACDAGGKCLTGCATETGKCATGSCETVGNCWSGMFKVHAPAPGPMHQAMDAANQVLGLQRQVIELGAKSAVYAIQNPIQNPVMLNFHGISIPHSSQPLIQQQQQQQLQSGNYPQHQTFAPVVYSAAPSAPIQYHPVCVPAQLSQSVGEIEPGTEGQVASNRRDSKDLGGSNPNPEGVSAEGHVNGSTAN